jgi:hypothetical protein
MDILGILASAAGDEGSAVLPKAVAALVRRANLLRPSRPEADVHCVVCTRTKAGWSTATAAQRYVSGGRLQADKVLLLRAGAGRRLSITPADAQARLQASLLSRTCLGTAIAMVFLSLPKGI